MRLFGRWLLGFLCGAATHCLCADLTLEQLNHRAYPAAQGAPSLVTVFAQSTDGMLWLGTSAGLFRFDGVRFVRYPETGDDPLPSSHIRALTASPDGGLWVGFLQSGVSFLRGGHVTSYSVQDGLPSNAINQFAWDPDGMLWVATSPGDLVRRRGSRWETVAKFERPRGVLWDQSGHLWVATTDHVFVRAPGEREFRSVADAQFPYNISSFIAASPRGDVWALLPGPMLRRLDPESTSDSAGRRLSVPGGARWPVLFDGEGNFWFGADALYRVSADHLSETNQTGETASYVERFSRVEGLTPGLVTALFVDREKNIWVATNGGIDRFSKTSVVRLSLPLCAGIGYAMVAGDAGSLWAACPRSSVPTGTLTEIRNGSIAGQQETEKFTSGYRDTNGEVWFGGANALGHLENGHLATTPLPEELRGTDVQFITRDRVGTLWMSVVGKGVFQLTDGHWTLQDSLPRVQALAESTDANGTMWFGYTDSRVARMQGGVVRIFGARDGLKVGHVTSILAQGGEIWAGGELGFAHSAAERFVPVLSGCDSAFTGVSGIVGTKGGDLWLNAIGGITHITREELQLIIRNPQHRAKCELLDALDGVPGNPIQTRPTPTALATTDGRLWFALTGGVVSIDPDHLIRNPLPPPVTITSVTSQGREYPNRGTLIQLPVNTKDLHVDYAAGSLTIPERVEFRYKLDGSDKEWQNGGNRRDATYTNLSPGNYTFHVIAANNDGIWNDAGRLISIRIAPAFYQTRWFYALCVLAFAGLLVSWYHVRIRQVQGRTVRLLEARLAERERIARELHDTLLQSVQGLIWRFHAATKQIPEGQPARELMLQSLDRAEKLLGESRDKVKDLRPIATEVTDLTQSLAAEGGQLGELHSARFRMSVEGVARDLHPIVREEGLLIAREALSNAFRHSGAKDVEVEVSYGNAAFNVRVRDDGRGISNSVLETGGRPGHFGLTGMRERAKKLGGQLEVWSKPEAGTEIDLRVPAHVAYRTSPARSSHSPLKFLRSPVKRH